jgi:hypothetical protein
MGSSPATQLLLVSVLATLSHLVGALSVSTAAGLQDALAKGTKHIQITQHLDLSEMSGDTTSSVLTFSTYTQSVRVRNGARTCARRSHQKQAPGAVSQAKVTGDILAHVPSC